MSMPSPPGAPFPQGDTFLGPIIQAVGTIIQNQLQGVGQVYTEEPDESPNDNSVLISFLKLKVLSDTNWKMKVQVSLDIRHVFIRSQMSQNVIQCRNLVMPYLLMFSAQENQNLVVNGNPLAIVVNPSEQAIIQWLHSNEPRAALRNVVDIITEFNLV